MSWQYPQCDTACNSFTSGECDGPSTPGPFAVEDYLQSMRVYLEEAERAWAEEDRPMAAFWWQMAGECWSLVMREPTP